MNRTIEIIAMALGGISLLTVCFLGFAVMSGIPLHDIAVVGNFFEAPAVPLPTASATAPEATAPRERATDEKAIMSQAALLHAWSLPSPFDPEELKELTDDLKLRLQRIEAREGELDTREEHLDDRDRAIQGRLEALVDMQGRLDKQREEMQAQQKDLDQQQEEVAAREAKKWQNTAKILMQMKPDDAAGYLKDANYEPQQMARILAAMDGKKAADVMVALQKKIDDPAVLRSFMDAYGEVSGGSERP